MSHRNKGVYGRRTRAKLAQRARIEAIAVRPLRSRILPARREDRVLQEIVFNLDANWGEGLLSPAEYVRAADAWRAGVQLSDMRKRALKNFAANRPSLYRAAQNDAS